MCNFYLMYWVDGQEKLKNERSVFLFILFSRPTSFLLNQVSLCRPGVSVSDHLSTPGAGFGPLEVKFQLNTGFSICSLFLPNISFHQIVLYILFRGSF